MKKISTKTLFFSLIGIVIALLIFDIYVWNNTKYFITNSIRLELKKKISLSKALIGEIDFEKLDKFEMYASAVQIKSLTSLRSTLIDKQGWVVADSEIEPNELDRVENHLQRPEVQQAMRTGSGLARRTSTTVKEELFYYCEPIRKNGRITGFIRLAMFSPDFELRMAYLKNLILISNIFLILFTIIASWWYVKWLSRQWAALKDSLAKQRESSSFHSISRQRYEEPDLIANEFNLLGERMQTSHIKLESQRDQLMTIFNSLNEGVAAFNNNGVAILHNLAFKNILGISSDNNNGIRFYDWIHFPPIIQDIEEFIEKGNPIKKRSKFYGDRYIEYQVSPLKMNDKLLSGFLLTIIDVTQLQQLETIRQDFVANVSHEFKTPLTSIRGYAETLISGAAEKKKDREKFLQKIENQTIHLENLVTDLLQLSRIEKKKTDDLEKMKPLPVIKKILKDYETLAAENKLTLHTDISGVDSKVKIRGNEQLLQNIISNLLSNAFRYNKPKGEIWFRLTAKKKKLRIEVEDNGFGIPPSLQERIFERFYRVESARYMFQEGSGLGLSIVKHAVELLSGNVGVESEEDKGSLFWVEIPLI